MSPALLLGLALWCPPIPSDVGAVVTSRTAILVYHDIVQSRGKGSVWFDCTLSELRSQLDWLKRHGAAFVTLDQLFAHLKQGRPLPPHAVVLTFADGYLGFYRLGLPELRKRRIPAAMFVHTGFVGSKVGRPKMTWPMLAELSKEGLVAVESQTVSHPADLGQLDDRQLDREMEVSKKELERRLGRKVSYLAYPNGKYDRRAMAAAKRAGYRMAFTEAQRPAESTPSLFEVPRYVHTRWRQAWRDAGNP